MLNEQLQTPQFREFVDVSTQIIFLTIETKIPGRITSRSLRTFNRPRTTNSSIFLVSNGSPPRVSLGRSHFRSQRH
jgi:hypothetical protein